MGPAEKCLSDSRFDRSASQLVVLFSMHTETILPMS